MTPRNDHLDSEIIACAQDFAELLRELADAKPSGATGALMMRRAADHIGALLAIVDQLDRDQAEEQQLDEVLDRVRGDLNNTAAAATEAGTRAELLACLPPMADPGQPMCQADSPRDNAGAYWDCNAKRGHVERWHASHDADDPAHPPMAQRFMSAAWPVAEHENGLPLMASGPALACGSVEGRWVCNSVSGHKPLDHVTFAGMGSYLAGAVLARWASVRPSAAVPRPGQDVEGVHSPSIAGPGYLNGHALRPPEWQCRVCEKRFSGAKPGDGLCVACFAGTTGEAPYGTPHLSAVADE